MEGVRRPLHREEVILGRDVHNVDASPGARGWPGPCSGTGTASDRGGAAGGGAGGAGVAGGDKVGRGDDGARRRRRKWRKYTDAGSGMKYYSNGVTTTWTRL